jgi:predicted enzyme related to lactoylglutathione lyase
MAGEPYYLEIVTPDVDTVCNLYIRSSGLQFAPGDETLGGARIARLPGGARLGVRAPLRKNEGPLWRIYLRVEDLDAAIAEARRAGAEVAIARMTLGGGHGHIGVVLQGGVEHGYWQIE